MNISNKLKGLSAEQLEKLASAATELANDLRKNKPSVALALANGVRDVSYSTPAWGMIFSYTGEAEIQLADGTKWRAIGHGPQGEASTVTKNGFIEFIKLS